ncbi:DNA mismatch repair protein MLH3, partial [Tremellales sp. Uapishka_1]
MSHASPHTLATLPTSTSTQIRSSVIIPTLPQVVSELIQNALDAQATKIECWIDLEDRGVRVEDDGVGVGKYQLRELGKRYATNKRLTESHLGLVDSYGYRGEALASISSLGLLEITSRTLSSNKTYTKIIKNSKTLYLGSSSRPLSGSCGTIVSIPVRQSTLNSTPAPTVVASCRKIIEAYALSRPFVRWTLWKENGVTGGGAKKVLGISGGKTSLEVYRSIYGMAGVERTRSEWIEGLLSVGDIGAEVYKAKTPTQELDSQSSSFHRHKRLQIDGWAEGESHESCEHHPVLQPPLSNLMEHSINLQFRKSSLATAKIVCQVDRKFVCCILDSNDAPFQRSLVLIDQHAADERISVECILKELCNGFLGDQMEVTDVDPDVKIFLSRLESDMLIEGGVPKIFRRWGIDFDLPDGSQTGDYIQIGIRAVPTVLSTRLGRKEGIEMTRLVKLYLAWLDDGGLEEVQTFLKADTAASQWDRALRFVPKEMMDLANSKACRGAIMFGDTLDMEQCERLVGQLADTQFPFMCAHGRPSLVPLRLVEDAPREMQESGRIDWRNWKEKNEVT